MLNSLYLKVKLSDNIFNILLIMITKDKYFQMVDMIIIDKLLYFLSKIIICNFENLKKL